MKARRSAGVGFGAILLAMHVVMIAGCNDLPSQSTAQIRELDRRYRAGHFADAERVATEVIRNHPDKPDTAEAYYLRGLSRVRTRRESLGEKDFAAGLRLCARPDLGGLLRLQLGGMAFDRDDYQTAARMYRGMAHAIPRGAPADETWYRYGVSLQRSGAFAEAATVFRRTVAEYPSSRFARDASRKRAWAHHYFTVQCGAFSQAASAHSACEVLQRRGVNGAQVAIEKGREAPYVVRAGRYDDYASARRALETIRRVQPDAFVVP